MLLQNDPGKNWKLAGDDPLIAGMDRHVLITATGTACVESIALEPAPAGQEKETWKLTARPNVVDVALDVPAHESSALYLAIRQFGDPEPATVSLVSYNEPAKLDALRFHAGDTFAILTGTSLDQVRQVEFGGLTFQPVGQGTAATQPGGKPELRLALPAEAKPPAKPAGDILTAQIALKDGRMLRLPVMVEPRRPAVILIGKADVPSGDSMPRSQLHVRLSSENDLPVSDALMFSLKSTQPFPRGGTIELANSDGSLHAALSFDSGSLILETPQTLLATFQPLKVLGPSAFGPIRLRAVAPGGIAGDWLPLVTLVRLPTLDGLSCPVAPPVVPGSRSKTSARPAAEAPIPTTEPTDPPDLPASSSPPMPKPFTPCTLMGHGLYFIDAIASDAAFTDSVRVPEGFVGSSLAVPPPTGAVYYLRLRDDPTAVNTVTLPTGPL
jgi:hypothetical protein